MTNNNDFLLSNGVRLGNLEAQLLLYRYLTDIYLLGALSVVQFIDGYLRGRGKELSANRALSVAGNGVGEVEKLLLLQWEVKTLDIMTVNASQMRVMRMLLEAKGEEISEFFQWAIANVTAFANLKELFESPGLSDYWKQESEAWKSNNLRDRVRLFSGSPWEIPPEDMYDVALLFHAQRLMADEGAENLIRNIQPGGIIAAAAPVNMIASSQSKPSELPFRFTELEIVKKSKTEFHRRARDLGYQVSSGEAMPVEWPYKENLLEHIVSFPISSQLRSLLAGELLIQSIESDMPNQPKLELLDSALKAIPPDTVAGAEALIILTTERSLG